MSRSKRDGSNKMARRVNRPELQYELCSVTERKGVSSPSWFYSLFRLVVSYLELPCRRPQLSSSQPFASASSACHRYPVVSDYALSPA